MTAPACKFCGRPDEGNPGDFYHEKDCHKRDVQARIRRVREAGRTPSRELRRELERASDTGD